MTISHKHSHGNEMGHNQGFWPSIQTGHFCYMLPCYFIYLVYGQFWGGFWVLSWCQIEAPVTILLGYIFKSCYMALFKATSTPLYSNFHLCSKPSKRHVFLCFSISKPYIKSNSMFLRWHWCKICAAADNTGLMAASGKYISKIRHQLRWPRFVSLNFNGS